jgi:hypothetical protein
MGPDKSYIPRGEESRTWGFGFGPRGGGQSKVDRRDDVRRQGWKLTSASVQVGDQRRRGSLPDRGGPPAWATPGWTNTSGGAALTP